MCRLLAVSCVLVAIVFFALQVHVLFLTPPESAIYGWDDTFYYAWLRSAFVGHDVDFSDDVAAAPSLARALKYKALFGARTEKGLVLNRYGVGWAVSSVPFYVIADVLTVIGRRLEVTDSFRDGYSPPYQFVILLGQLLYAFAGLVLSYLIVRRFVPGPAAVLGVTLTWLSSFMLYYQSVNLSMAHSITFVWICAAYYSALRAKEQPDQSRWWVALGIAAGMVVICRYQAVLYLIFPAAVAFDCLRARKARLTHVLMGLLPAALIVGIQLTAWKLLYGQWLLYTYGDVSFHWLEPRLFEVLFSPFHGLYYWHPMLLVGTTGLIIAMVFDRKIPRTWLLIFFLTLYVNAAWEMWWFGAAFGGRAFEGCVLFFMLGTAIVFRTLRDKPVAASIVLAVYVVAAAWNANLVWLVKKNIIRGDQPATYGQMLSRTASYYSHTGARPK